MTETEEGKGARKRCDWGEERAQVFRGARSRGVRRVPVLSQARRNTKYYTAHMCVTYTPTPSTALHTASVCARTHARIPDKERGHVGHVCTPTRAREYSESSSYTSAKR